MGKGNKNKKTDGIRLLIMRISYPLRKLPKCDHSKTKPSQ